MSGRPLYYKNSIIHRSIANFMLQGGGELCSICVLLSYHMTAYCLVRLHEAQLVAEENLYMVASSPMKISLVIWTLRGAFAKLTKTVYKLYKNHRLLCIHYTLAHRTPLRA